MDSILITGANRGLGLEFARAYAADGWRVFAACRRPSAELEALAGAHPALRIHPLDVADHASIDALAAVLAGEPIDVLLNNAGRFGRLLFGAGGVEDQRFGAIDYEDWALTFRINVMGPMKMAEAFVEQVAASRQRKIVTLSSMLGSMALNGIGGLYPYRSTKAGVNAVMKSLSIDLGKRGIAAVALHPGWVRTAMGGPGAEIDAPEAVAGMRRVIADLTLDKVGHVIAWNGERLPY